MKQALHHYTEEAHVGPPLPKYDSHQVGDLMRQPATEDSYETPGKRMRKSPLSAYHQENEMMRKPNNDSPVTNRFNS